MKYLILTLFTILAPIAACRGEEDKDRHDAAQPKISTGNLGDLIEITKVEAMGNGEWYRFTFTAKTDIDAANRKRLADVCVLRYTQDRTFIGRSDSVVLSLNDLPEAVKINRGDRFTGSIDNGKSKTWDPIVAALEIFSTFDPKMNEEGEQAAQRNR